jgi:hypothetical protein
MYFSYSESNIIKYHKKILEIAFLGKPVAFNLSNIQNESTKSHSH